MSGRPEFSEVVTRYRMPGLDGLRAIGVVGVIAAHSAFVGGLPADFGPTAFFVLSGFLITRLLLSERAETGTISISRFYVRRTLRIFPAYYAFLLISYVLDARAGQRWHPEFLLSAVTYTINYFNAFNHHPTTSLAHAWSLAVEEQFYLLWPLVFAILAARGRRALVLGAGLVALAAVAWRSWLILGAHVDPSYVYNAFETRFDNLAVGCLLAIAVELPRFVAAAKWCGKRSWFPLVTGMLLFVSRVVLSDAYHYSVGLTIDSLLIAVFITQILQLSGSRLWCWLEWRWVRYLGKVSYPMYLYHAWGASVGRLVPGHVPALEFAGGVLATVILASGSYYLIERPVLRFKARRASNTWQHVPAPPPPVLVTEPSFRLTWPLKLPAVFRVPSSTL